MALPYIGEIRMFAGNFAPQGWMFCDGQLLPIAEYDALFTLIGTTYGGDGMATFALPDLRGRLPVHMGTGVGGSFWLAETGGSEEVTLTLNQVPSHVHQLMAAGAGATSRNPVGHALGKAAASIYVPTYAPTSLSAQAIGVSGGSQSHNNGMPYLCVNFIICLAGLFPSQT